MRIRELLEAKKFDEKEYVLQTGEGRELNFDLIEDLIHFMNEDDDIYRRHTYPAIASCIDKVSAKGKPSHNIFAPAVKECYKLYSQKFPIRELPEELDEKMCEQVCEKIHETVIQHITNGKYKG
jgi:hypothetical protein